jgi:hypothetical protein
MLIMNILGLFFIWDRQEIAGIPNDIKHLNNRIIEQDKLLEDFLFGFDARES